MSEAPSIGILDPDGIQERARRRIQEGWALLIGDGVDFERKFYPPGTEANADFEAFFGPSPIGSSPAYLMFFLFKPNKRWTSHARRLLRAQGDDSSPNQIVMAVCPNDAPENLAVYFTLEEVGHNRLASVRAWLDELNLCTAYKNGIIGPSQAVKA